MRTSGPGGARSLGACGRACVPVQGPRERAAAVRRRPGPRPVFVAAGKNGRAPMPRHDIESCRASEKERDRETERQRPRERERERREEGRPLCGVGPEFTPYAKQGAFGGAIKCAIRRAMQYGARFDKLRDAIWCATRGAICQALITSPSPSSRPVLITSPHPSLPCIQSVQRDNEPSSVADTLSVYDGYSVCVCARARARACCLTNI